MTLRAFFLLFFGLTVSLVAIRSARVFLVAALTAPSDPGSILGQVDRVALEDLDRRLDRVRLGSKQAPSSPAAVDGRGAGTIRLQTVATSQGLAPAGWLSGAVALFAIATTLSVGLSLALHRRLGPLSAPMFLLHVLVGLGGLILLLASLYARTPTVPEVATVGFSDAYRWSDPRPGS